MATATLPDISNFLSSDQAPTLAQVRVLRRVCEQNAYERQALTDAHRSGVFKDPVRAGILAYCLGFLGDAEEALSGSRDDLGRVILALVYESAGEHEDALKHLDAAAKKSEDARGESARVLLDLDRIDAAEAVIKDLPEGANTEFLRGRVEEARGAIERAISLFEAALELDTEHVDAAFKLGVLLDRIGDDDMAIEYYLVCADATPPYMPGVINLGILYDERGEANAAIDCFRQVLSHNPSNDRARILLRDSRASRSMFYDEKEERERERMEKILKTSVNDFELSVRSRNCLAKMNIFTLGDLISISETEMLNYKNFGETSLKEVKEMLDARNLRLGMLRDPNDDRGHSRADQKTLAENVDRLELSSKTIQVLEYLRVGKIGDLLRYNDLDLYRAPGAGQSVVQELSTALGAYGLGILQPDVK